MGSTHYSWIAMALESFPRVVFIGNCMYVYGINSGETYARHYLFQLCVHPPSYSFKLCIMKILE